VAEKFVHQPLVGCSGVFEAKVHDLIVVICLFYYESGFIHIGLVSWESDYTQTKHQKTENIVPCRYVN